MPAPRALTALSVLVVAALASSVGVGSAAPAGARGITTKRIALPANIYGPEAYEDSTVTEGHEGAIWFIYDRESRRGPSSGLGRITPSGVITLFPVQSHWFPEGVAAGPDGAVWFTMDGPGGPGSPYAGAIGRITTTGHITSFPLPPPTDLNVHCDGQLSCSPGFNYHARGIAAGPEGDLWVTGGLESVWRVTPSGSVTTFATPTQFGFPSAITSGASGVLWAIDGTENQFYLRPRETLAQITPTGMITESSPLASEKSGERLGPGIVSMPDGSLWLGGQGFLESVTPTGQAVKHPVSSWVWDGTLGPDGDPWFSTSKGLITVTHSGQIREIPEHNGPYFQYSGIASGPHGTLWLVKLGGHSVLRLSLG
jgi:virginiamycin B lyase